jgi:hypothetical protein
MPINLRMPVMAACVALAACTSAQEPASQALDTVGNETGASYNKMRGYLDLGPRPKPVQSKDVVQPRYCYHTYEDIICYSQPLPGEEYRLVAFQSASGKTGYTLPPAPTNVVMPPLPPPKPTTIGPPPPAKPNDDKQLKEIIFDPSELEPKELVPDKIQ